MQNKARVAYIGENGHTDDDIEDLRGQASSEGELEAAQNGNDDLGEEAEADEDEDGEPKRRQIANSELKNSSVPCST